jgi:EF-hand domain pair
VLPLTTATTTIANATTPVQLTNRYDRDSSGAMDAVEVGSLLEDLGVTPTEERLHAAFAEFDSNGDGLVTLEEASHFVVGAITRMYTHCYCYKCTAA